MKKLSLMLLIAAIATVGVFAKAEAKKEAKPEAKKEMKKEEAKSEKKK